MTEMREKLIEVGAKRLYEKMEHLDPSDGRGWEELTEREREFYRLSLEDALDTFLAILREPDDGMKARMASMAYESIRMEEKWPELFHRAYTAMIDTIAEPARNQPTA